MMKCKAETRFGTRSELDDEVAADSRKGGLAVARSKLTEQCRAVAVRDQ